MRHIFGILALIFCLSIGGMIFFGEDKNDNTNTEQTENTTEVTETIANIAPETVKFEKAIDNYFSLESSQAQALTFKKMRVYPIKASKAYLAQHQTTGNYINLKEALAKRDVSIGEMDASSSLFSVAGGGESSPISNTIIPQHRGEEVQVAGSNSGAVNTLTIENNSHDTIFIMAGDVVEGGKQDRVLAQDMILPPYSGQQTVAVFCVEPGRWSYKSQNKASLAFNGYMNVASNSVRHSAKFSKDQSEVWSEVNRVTSVHNAKTQSGTYNALEKSKGFQKEKGKYLGFFENQFDNQEETIGVVVVTGDKVLACDIFATPNLFKKQYKLLLHSYITEVVSYGSEITLGEAAVTDYFKEVEQKYFETQENETDLKFASKGKIVHFSDVQE